MSEHRSEARTRSGANEAMSACAGEEPGSIMSAAQAMLKSEARLLARNPGVVIWTAILPVAGAIVLACYPGGAETVGCTWAG